MIKLPKFDEQSMFDYETYNSLTTNEERLGKFLAHYEAMKLAVNIPGEIVECGVFKGTSLMRFALMRQIMGGQNSAKIFGFDVFSNKYPKTKYKEDNIQRDYWINTAGAKSISDKQLKKLFIKKGIKNFSLIPGDVTKTIPKFIKRNPGFKISLLNIDIDFVEPTLITLEYFYDRVSKGGIILFDNYAGKGNSGEYLFGDTKGIDDFFKNKSISIKRFSFTARPCYLIKK